MILQTVKNMEYLNMYPKAPLMAFSEILQSCLIQEKEKALLLKNNYPQYCWEI